MVRDAVAAMAAQPAAYALDVLDPVVQFDEAWPDFAEAVARSVLGSLDSPAVPVDPDAPFRVWDDLPPTRTAWAGLDLQQGAQRRVHPLGPLPPASIQLVALAPTDLVSGVLNDDVRSVLVHNPWAADAQAGARVHVLAIWHTLDGDWVREDWTRYEWIGFCRDFRNQRFDELVIAVANASHEAGSAPVPARDLEIASDSTGCAGYAGTVTTTNKHRTWSGLGEKTTAQVVFQARPHADALDFHHPMMPDTLRVGAGAMLVPTGESYETRISYTKKNGCAVSGGPTTQPVGNAQGMLLTNPFPELQRVASGFAGGWFGEPARAYSGLVVPLPRPIPITVCGDMEVALSPVLLRTEEPGPDGLAADPPRALESGRLEGTHSKRDFTWEWSLDPRPQ